MRSAEDIRKLVSAQVAEIEEPERREALERILIPPEPQTRTWIFGDEEHRCWIVARSAGVLLVFCESGFGTGSYPWGFVNEEDRDLGTDGQWHVSIEHALIGSPVPSGPLPPDYEVP